MPDSKNKIMKMLAVLLTLALCTSFLNACANSQESIISIPDDNGSHTAEGFNVNEYDWAYEEGSDRYAGRTLRILLTIGGAGNYYEPVAKRMMEYYPGLTVELNYTQGAADVLRTEILADNAPDIFNCNVGDLPHHSIIEQGICAPIDPVFDVPVLDGSEKIGSLLDMELFDTGKRDGRYYIFPDLVYETGLWYDAAWFRENELTVPHDFESFTLLASRCKEIGAYALGVCGLMSHEYPVNYWFWPMVASTDIETYRRLQDYDYEAWRSEGMQKVVDKMLYLSENGFFDKSTNSLGNAETQMAFIDHEFALLPCGSWLETEMADAWPPDFELTYLPYSFGDTDGNEYLTIDSLASFISSSTENMDLVCEFYRFLFSDPESIRGAVSIHTNIYRIPGFMENYSDLLAPSVSDAVSKSASMSVLTGFNASSHPEIGAELGKMIVALMGGSISGEEFIERGYELYREAAV